MPEIGKRTECKRCGTCCTKGGPALHHEDIDLLQKELLSIDQIITIRKGEPVFSLTAGDPAPAASEIIKIKGKGTVWTCVFLDSADLSCMIYAHRPIECQLLKCWDTEDLQGIAGINLLSRYDILEPNDPVVPFMKSHDEKCSLENLGLLCSALRDEDSQQSALSALTGMVNTDLAIRSQVYARFHLSLDRELFFFGRPLFKILQEFGVEMHDHGGSCRLTLVSQQCSTVSTIP